MNIRILHHPPEPTLASALTTFEQEFTYPLGADRRFRIVHGRESGESGESLAGNAWSFFHALSNTSIYVVAEDHGRVLGTIGAALRRIVRPDGTSASGLYLGDLKIVQHERGSLVLYRLFQGLKAWAVTQAPFGDALAYSIVMNGTAVTPAEYSGRLGFSAFTAVGSATILWLRTFTETATETAAEALPSTILHPVSPPEGQAVFSALACSHYHLPEVHSHRRSQLKPCWWITADSRACGQLEDTLLSKRLWTTTGDEMRSAHLSHFAFSEIHSGVSLVQAALAQAATAGYPMLFVAVPPATTDVWRQQFGNRLQSVASATIFGTSATLPPGSWLINTADI